MPFDIRHISIIDSLPVYNTKKEILTVGCGTGNLEVELGEMGYDVISTDFGVDSHTAEGRKKNIDKLNYEQSNILDLSTFSVKSRETVICSEVLEHIEDWKTAFINLIKLTDRKLIITVPWRESFNVEGPPPDGHCNFWTDLGNDPWASTYYSSKNNFGPILEFSRLAYPWHVSITKICTKAADWASSSRCYLITVDKNQYADFCTAEPELRKGYSININDTERREMISSPFSPNISPYIPPRTFGPPLPFYENMDLLAFVSEPFTKNLDNLNYLRHVESLLSNYGIRLCAVVASKEFRKHAKAYKDSLCRLSRNNTLGCVNIDYAVPDNIIESTKVKSKFLIAPSWAQKNKNGIYSHVFDLTDESLWIKIATSLRL